MLNRDGCLSKDTRTTLSSLAAKFSCAPGEEVEGKEGWSAATKERYAFNIALLLRAVMIPLATWRARAMLEIVRRARLDDPHPLVHPEAPPADSPEISFNAGHRTLSMLVVPDFTGIAHL